MTWHPITPDPDSLPDTEGWYLLRYDGDDGREYVAARMRMSDGEPEFSDANVYARVDIDEWDCYRKIEDNDNG